MEYIHFNVKIILEKSGTQHHTRTSYTLQHNGLAERDMRIIIEGVKNLISNKNLHTNLCAQMINKVLYVLNHTGFSDHGGNMPNELCFNNTPKVDPFRIFGRHVDEQRHSA